MKVNEIRNLYSMKDVGRILGYSQSQMFRLVRTVKTIPEPKRRSGAPLARRLYYSVQDVEEIKEMVKDW